MRFSELVSVHSPPNLYKPHRRSRYKEGQRKEKIGQGMVWKTVDPGRRSGWIWRCTEENGKQYVGQLPVTGRLFGPREDFGRPRRRRRE
ncbi:Hypothetical protein CINCED_3A021554 [Cinara cedri]|uniref:Uncharacterized protein n=1 Tax=Cinara cedri TaxID=506608 RepID=A0A5E4MKZ7_9HEMI|nr:Hypothetical protein CINCED_3A021554 [Cinara cedri]